VCEESFDFVAPMIAIETISADTAMRREARAPHISRPLLEGSLHLAGATRPTIHDRSKHGPATRGTRKKLCGSSTCARNSQAGRGCEGFTLRGARDVADKSPKRTRVASITPAARFGQYPKLSNCGSGDFVLDPSSRQEVDEFTNRFGRTKMTD